ncbi:hypothetical protein GWI33_015821 [Rhynchophorus ferrugineus]|uniref:Uncharacterized protein n=1 Tax=Rhynchophorus ferrugineus TaxID=354439 RepID=A0A834I4M8_RHYFE|nr:hypothetical protein GWI33_015821 [Rhynchophorus ferrugineus]
MGSTAKAIDRKKTFSERKKTLAAPEVVIVIRAPERDGRWEGGGGRVTRIFRLSSHVCTTTKYKSIDDDNNNNDQKQQTELVVSSSSRKSERKTEGGPGTAVSFVAFPLRPAKIADAHRKCRALPIKTTVERPNEPEKNAQFRADASQMTRKRRGGDNKGGERTTGGICLRGGGRLIDGPSVQVVWGTNDDTN